jgi:hypothetical protein
LRRARLREWVCFPEGLSPRLQHLVALWVFAAIIGVCFRDVLFGGRTLQTTPLLSGTTPTGPFGFTGYVPSNWPVLDAGASAWQYEPWTYQIHRTVVRGELPLWNPHAALGEPLAANLLSGAFVPLRWPLFAWPNPYLADLYLLLRLVLAAWLTYLFVRRIGLDWLAGVTAGLIFALSGYFVLYVNMTHLDVEIWLPLVLLGVERLAERPDARGVSLLALSTAIPVLGGNPESGALLLLVAGLYLIARRSWRLDFISRGAAGLALGIALAAPLLVPAIELVWNAAHAHPRSVGLIKQSGKNFVLALVPDFFGPPHRAWTTGISHWGALSATPWALALAGVLAPGWRKGRPFFAILLGVSLLKLYGAPIVNWIGRLPLLDQVIFTSTSNRSSRSPLAFSLDTASTLFVPAEDGGGRLLRPHSCQRRLKSAGFRRSSSSPV